MQLEWNSISFDIIKFSWNWNSIGDTTNFYSSTPTANFLVDFRINNYDYEVPYDKSLGIDWWWIVIWSANGSGLRMVGVETKGALVDSC